MQEKKSRKQKETNKVSLRANINDTPFDQKSSQPLEDVVIFP